MHDNLRDTVIKSYTNLLSGNLDDKNDLKNEMHSIFSQVENNIECLSIIADLTYHLHIDEIEQGVVDFNRFNNLMSCASLQLLLELLFLFLQHVSNPNKEDSESEYTNMTDKLSVILPNIMLIYSSLFSHLESFDNSQFVSELSREHGIAHSLEKLYREIHDLNNELVNELLSNSKISPSNLLLYPQLINSTEEPEVLAYLFTSAGYLLPKIKNIAINISLNDLINLFHSVDIAKSTGDCSADNECIAAYYSLCLQHIIRRCSLCPEEIKIVNTDRLYCLYIQSFAQHRLSMVSRLITEPLDIGLVCLSEVSTTELTLITSALEVLSNTFFEQISALLQQYFNNKSVRDMIYMNIYATVVASSIFRQEYIDAVVECLSADTIAFTVQTIRYYDIEINNSLEPEGELASNFESMIGYLLNKPLGLFENWIKSYAIASLIKLNQNCFQNILHVLAKDWWMYNNINFKNQCVLVVFSIIQFYIAIIESDNVYVENETTQNNSSLAQNSILTALHKIMNEDDCSNLIIQCLLFIHDSSSEFTVLEWCEAFLQFLKTYYANLSLVINAEFNDPHKLPLDVQGV